MAISIPSVAAVRQQRHVSQLTEVATTGISDARVALAEQRYADAQRQLTEVNTRIAAEPQLLAKFSPDLDQLLEEAAFELRVQRFYRAAERARVEAMPAIGIDPDTGADRSRIEDARRSCADALNVFGILETPQGINRAKEFLVDRSDDGRLREAIAELLFLLAQVELELGQQAGSGDLATRRAIALLDDVEELLPGMKSVYEYRRRYWSALGDTKRSDADAERRGMRTPRHGWITFSSQTGTTANGSSTQPKRKLKRPLLSVSTTIGPGSCGARSKATCTSLN